MTIDQRVLEPLSIMAAIAAAAIITATPRGCTEQTRPPQHMGYIEEPNNAQPDNVCRIQDNHLPAHHQYDGATIGSYSLPRMPIEKPDPKFTRPHRDGRFYF
ncbi:MAG: hypothetical protein KKD17_02570 [Nanoarchaeota archaeon]|nr:hypothetical protein [Nanoarchaeota archaeon]